MKKEQKRITSMINHFDYELLQNMFFQNSDGAMVTSFITEMTNIIKLELDGLKIFTKSEIHELMDALNEKEISFSTVQPKHSFLYILKDYYKFDIKKEANKELIKKIDGLNNLQVIVLARFLLTFSASKNENIESFDNDQIYHFFLNQEDKGFKIITKVINPCSKEEEIGRKVEEIIEQKGLENLEQNISDLLGKKDHIKDVKKIIVKTHKHD